MRERISRLRRLHLPAAILLLLASCGALPDVEPFAGATGDLRDAIVKVEPAVTGEVERAEFDDEYVKQLKDAWAARIDAVNGMNDYSQSLVAIVGAGNSGSETADQIGDSFRGLLEKADVIIPGSGEVAATASDAVKFLAKTYINIKATSDLADALDAAQPGINTFTKLMTADLDDMDGILQTALVAMDFQRSIENNKKFGSYEALIEQRAQLQGVYAKAQAENTKHYRKMADAIIASPNTPFTNPPFSKDQLKEMSDALAEVEKLIKSNESWIGPLKEQQKKDDERIAAARQLIAGTQTGLRQWSAAHANLVEAVRAGRTPNFHSLIKTAVEIEELVGKFKSL